jgi:predicted ATPase
VGSRAHMAQLTVSRFTRRQTEVMVERVAGGKTLPADVMRQVVAKTDGVPLFVEELTKMVLESGLVREREDRYELTGALPPLAIPSTLQDSLMARLDRLASVKEVAQVGAALGRSFSYDLLRTIASVEETTLNRSLTTLVDAEFLHLRGVPPHATYIFKHALIQDAAYQSMLISRRQQLHQRIAQLLVEKFSETAQMQPELVAHHYTEGGLAGPAVEYWRRAGERAIERFANPEAIAHLTRGIDVSKGLTDPPQRIEQEIMLRAAMMPALWVSRGWAAPEVEESSSRLRELCQHAGETPRLLPALWGLAAFHTLRGEIRAGLELEEQACELAERGDDRAALAFSHFLVGDLWLWFPELASARTHLEQGLRLYEPERDRSRVLLSFGYDIAIASLTFLSRVLWHLGYVNQATTCGERALAIAAELSHPFSKCWALSWIAALYQLLGDAGRVRELSEKDVALASEQMIPFFTAHGMALRGWALAKQGRADDGIAQLREGIAAYRATGANLESSHWLGLLAEACGDANQPEEGLLALAEALADIEGNGVKYFAAELHRLRGELLLKKDAPDEVEAAACFRRAIDVATAQQAKSLELRATTSLSRLLRRQGKREDARRQLAEIYGWFTEGFDTADLKDARALLDSWTKEEARPAR